MQSPTNAQIRAWARENGLAVLERGRIPARVLDAYAAAHGGGTNTAPDQAAAATAPVQGAPVEEPAATTAVPTPGLPVLDPFAQSPVDPQPSFAARDRERRLLLPIAALLTLSLLGAALHLLLRDDDPSAREAGGTGEVTFEDVRLGDCTAEIPEGVTLTVRVLPCGEPHEGEVYATFELSGDDYPGSEEVERFSLGGCQREAVAALPPDDETLYDLVYLAPSDQTWARGDRTVSCILSDPTGEPLVGSVVKGTARR